jgi:hypothetical protein
MAKSSTMKEWGKDKTSFSNLPQEITHVEYPKESQYSDELDDTMTGIDAVQEHGKGKVRKHMSNQK